MYQSLNIWKHPQGVTYIWGTYEYIKFEEWMLSFSLVSCLPSSNVIARRAESLLFCVGAKLGLMLRATCNGMTKSFVICT